jgi:hypothetical protein
MAEALPIISMASTVIGGVVSGIGAKQQADAQANAANYNAAVARNAALFAQQQGEVNAQANDRKTAAMIGRQRAVYAAGGIDVNSGSPLDIQADTADFGRLNSLTIRNNAARDAYGYQANANLDEASASNYEQAGNTALIGSLIGTAGSVGSKWSSFAQEGVDPFAIGAFG